MISIKLFFALLALLTRTLFYQNWRLPVTLCYMLHFTSITKPKKLIWRTVLARLLNLKTSRSWQNLLNTCAELKLRQIKRKQMKVHNGCSEIWRDINDFTPISNWWIILRGNISVPRTLHCAHSIPCMDWITKGAKNISHVKTNGKQWTITILVLLSAFPRLNIKLKAESWYRRVTRYPAGSGFRNILCLTLKSFHNN